MKTQIWVSGIFLAAATMVRAATNDPATALQKGLFEEEANHNLDAAIRAYQSVIGQFDKDRKLAATAIFRLGECYRKQGNTNEANAQYERVLREFPDQTQLVTLSRTYLAASGQAKPAEAATSVLPSAAVFEDADTLKRIQAMVKDSPDLMNIKDGAGQTPLSRAVEHRQFTVAQFLLASGAEVDTKDKNGNTPLHMAAVRGDKAMVELLLGYKADIQSTEDRKNTPLHLAAGQGYRTVVEVLLAHKADVNAKSDQGTTPLHRAAERGFKSIAEVLISHGADVNAADNDGLTPLHSAAEKGNQAIAELLLASKANVNARSADGKAPLHLAASNGHQSMAALLLAHGADVNARRTDGMTPLAAAVLSDAVSAARVLLDRKADPNIAFEINDKKPRSPLYAAVAKGNRDLVDPLLKAGANPNFQDQSDGNTTPLGTAVWYQKKDIVVLLLDSKADPNIPDPFGRTPVHRAVGQPPILELLLAAKADVNARTKDGETPLHWAAGGGLKPSAEMLLAHGADINAVAKDGSTPLHYAVLGNRKELLDWLLDNKADPNIRDNTGKTPLELAKSTRMIELPMAAPGVSVPRKVVAPPQPISPGELAQITAALKSHGAVENMPDFSCIRIMRKGQLETPEVVYSCHTNGINQFTLMEVVARFYAEQERKTPSPFRVGSWDSYKGSLSFPDFTKIQIHRPDRSQPARQTEITVNLLTATNSFDCSQDVRLRFGDVVDLPEREHTLAEPRVGLTRVQQTELDACLKRNVKFVVKGQTTELVLHSFTDYSHRPGVLSDQKPLDDPDRNYLSHTLRLPGVQKILSSSSDFSRVHIKRTDPDTGKTKEYTENVQSIWENEEPLSNDLWLRDGDVVEVPDKP